MEMLSLSHPQSSIPEGFLSQQSSCRGRGARRGCGIGPGSRCSPLAAAPNAHTRLPQPGSLPFLKFLLPDLETVNPSPAFAFQAASFLLPLLSPPSSFPSPLPLSPPHHPRLLTGTLRILTASAACFCSLLCWPQALGGFPARRILCLLLLKCCRTDTGWEQGETPRDPPAPDPCCPHLGLPSPDITRQHPRPARPQRPPLAAWLQALGSREGRLPGAPKASQAR